MSAGKIGRRTFLQAGASGMTALSMAHRTPGAVEVTATSKPALLGGEPMRKEPFPSWPQIDERYEKMWQEVLEKRGWCRLNGDYVERFEAEYAKTIGSRFCLAVANGTSALIASLNALGVGPGDEVLVPPYTFVATINAVLLQYALPVFVDTDRETFQMDASEVEALITERTTAMIPVHLGGNVVDMDTLSAVSKKRNVPIIEDACQAHFAEWRGKRVASLGDTGCFSFQVTKNLCSGEGGAMLTDREDLIERAGSFHTNGRPWRETSGFSYVRNGSNLRMTEFQGALLFEQLPRVEAQSQIREQNAAHLTKRLEAVPGIYPEKTYEGTTRNAYHLYMFRYDAEAFGGLSRDRFREALSAEGIPSSPGYTPLNGQPFLKEALYSRGFLNVYGKAAIDGYFERMACPKNDRLCTEAVWFTQNMLLGPQQDMDDIADAIERIYANAKALMA
ncbi:MAG: L-glutamine:scyllo-inosose aminotransferase [Candidatus Hydrogenedentes bacterium ADurb.Bin179]|nr:MAG: L-glutamine:scyllo-inosose aminotransferase [Candidatus Hydrogenedentes bacterium ADurb.Bin179]